LHEDHNSSALSTFVSRVLSQRGKELVQLAGATIRNVSRGVVGISMVQAVLAGAGFLVAGIPAPRRARLRRSCIGYCPNWTGVPVFTGRRLELDGDGYHTWPDLHRLYDPGRLTGQHPQASADGARGLTTPMPVIMVGVIGGTIAYGIVGLFFGPIVLSVAWAVMATWVRGGDAPEEGQTCSQQNG
jgi:hypothetical protein